MWMIKIFAFLYRNSFKLLVDFPVGYVEQNLTIQRSIIKDMLLNYIEALNKLL